MESLDINKFRRSNKDLLSCFDIKEKNTVVTKDISIVYPEFYDKKGLCVVKDTTNLLCMFAVLDKVNNLYCKCIAPVMHSFTPTERTEVIINNEVYVELSFKAGDVFTPYNDTVKSSTYLFTLFELFFLQGKIPFFMDYFDLSKLFLETSKYTGVGGVGDSAISNEILATLITRDKRNLDIFYKTSIKSNKECNDAVFIGLNDTFYGFDNVTSRLIGNYLNECTINSIIDPDDKPNKIGYILQQ